MKIISWNLNGIRACHKKGLIDFVKKEKPDIFCVQETKAHIEQVEDEAKHLGYIHLKEKLKTGREIVVVGDYNVAHKEIDVYDPKRLSTESGFLPEERAWFDSFLELGFVDSFRKFHPEAKDRYSWWSYRELARIS